jgi:exopolysaccharide biosynthesis polyprenyl glycosylphosphotransferase
MKQAAGDLASQTQAKPDRVTGARIFRLDTRAFFDARPWWRDALRRRLLALADAAGALGATVALGAVTTPDMAVWASFFVPVWIVLAKIQGLYDRDHRALRHLTVDEVPRLAVWTLTCTAALIGLLALTPAGPPDFSEALTLWLVATASTVLLRAIARFAWRTVTPNERVLIVGEGPLADATRRKLELFPDIHADVVGRQPQLRLGELREGRLAGLDRIILASPAIDEALIARLVELCRSTHTKLSVVPPARGFFGTAVQLEHVADLPVIEYNTWDVSRSTLALKRSLDVGVSLLGLVLLAPLFVIVAGAVKLDSRGPVFFRQMRAGLAGRPFRIVKFRTMVADAESRLASVVRLDELDTPMFKFERDPRVTRVGRVLRRTSFDELPQLWNVLRGEMSLVGPRPEQLDLVERYAPEHRFRLEVKPGMTGPMQVYGRGRLTFEERLAVEREYIENLSLGRDVRILSMTLAAIVGGRGAF